MGKDIVMQNLTKRGYYTIEAAIFLPVFIIAMVTLVYVIRIICIEERITHIMTDEGRYLSARAYDNLTMASGINMGFLLGIHLEDRFNSEVKYDTPYIITEYRYLFEEDGLTGLIDYSLSYQNHLKMPINLVRSRTFDKKLLLRGFIGADYNQDAFDYESMEENKESIIVWVFPKAGEKYHVENCRHIKVYPRQIALSKAFMTKYKSCSHCKNKITVPGSLVYIFSESGGVYHHGNCFTVDRYVVSMDKETAKNKGYIPCKTCGGE